MAAGSLGKLAEHLVGEGFLACLGGREHRLGLAFLGAAGRLLERDVQLDHQFPFLDRVLVLDRANTDDEIGEAVPEAQVATFSAALRRDSSANKSGLRARTRSSSAA